VLLAAIKRRLLHHRCRPTRRRVLACAVHVQYLSTTVDGWNWNHTSALTSCTLPIYSSPEQPFGCLFRYQGGAKQSGCQYPQGMSLTTPGLEGFWAIFSLGKEDIWVLHAPFESL